MRSQAAQRCSCDRLFGVLRRLGCDDTDPVYRPDNRDLSEGLLGKLRDSKPEGIAASSNERLRMNGCRHLRIGTSRHAEGPRAQLVRPVSV